jgi:putative Holliday junction resolvase
MAKQVLINSGVKKNKRKNKELLDKISAVIILQDYLKSKESDQSSNK